MSESDKQQASWRSRLSLTNLRRSRSRHRHRQRHRQTPPWLDRIRAIPFYKWSGATAVFFLLLAIVVLLLPFRRMAQARARLANPSDDATLALPLNVPWCLVGDFQAWDAEKDPLFDDGTHGDQVAGDGIFSRAMAIDQPGEYPWNVLTCGDWTHYIPETSAWVMVTSPEQTVTFTVDANRHTDGLWPPQFAMSADDGMAAEVAAIGDFQGWDSSDPAAVMSSRRNGPAEAAATIAFPGEHKALIAVRDGQSYFGANGRSQAALPLAFHTTARNETVVFTFDQSRNRLAVQYGMPGWLAWLAYRQGAVWLGVGATLIALFLGVTTGQALIIANPNLYVEAGCPLCQQQEFKRVPRRFRDRLLVFFGFPVRRYLCGQCGWRGLRLHKHEHGW